MAQERQENSETGFDLGDKAIRITKKDLISSIQVGAEKKYLI